MTSSLRSKEPCRYSKAVKGSAHWLDDYHAGEKKYDPKQDGWDMLKTTFTLEDHPITRTEKAHQTTETREQTQRTLVSKVKEDTAIQRRMKNPKQRAVMGTPRTLSADRLATAAQTLRSSASFASTTSSASNDSLAWPHVRGVASATSTRQLSATHSRIDMETSYWTKRNETATVRDAGLPEKTFHRTASGITLTQSDASIKSSKSSTFLDD